MSLTIEKCLQAWTNSLRQMNAKADIVFFGDSLIYYGDFAMVFPNKVVCNLGLRGDTLQGMIDRVAQIQQLQPKRVFLLGGINDVAHVTADEFEALYIRLMDAISQSLPQAIITAMNMLPVNNQDFSLSCNNAQIDICNSKIHKIAEDRKLNYLDIHALYVDKGKLPLSLTIDGVHLNADAYARWYKVLSESFVRT